MLKRISEFSSYVISRFKRAVDCVNRWFTGSLFRHVVSMLAVVLAGITVLGVFWNEEEISGWESLLISWRSIGGSRADQLKLAFTAMGGLGGTIYLVIKYRERHSLEQAEVEQKILHSAQQLGSESPQVRIAGVYALTEVADTHRGKYRQRVVDLLCGYLRTERRSWDAKTQTYVCNDAALEDVILNVISQHMHKNRNKNDKTSTGGGVLNEDQLWCDCVINLRGAIIGAPIEFSDLYFGNSVNFHSAVLYGPVDFRHTYFIDANFREVQFRGDTTFAEGMFENSTFCGARFMSPSTDTYTNFDGAVFDRVEIRDVIFKTGASFRGAQFSQAIVFEEIEAKELDLGIIASGDAYFKSITLEKGDFSKAKFLANATFDYFKFSRKAQFERARFLGAAAFKEEVLFEGSAYLSKVVFNEVDFEGALFWGRPDFSESRFNKGHNLSRKNFLGETPIGLGDNWMIDDDQEGGDDTENDHDDE